MTDARMSINLPGHPKMKRVIRSLGDSGAWHVIKLFLWVAGNRPDGDLSGLTADDIELSIDWRGSPGAFVSELVAVRFLDKTDAGYQVHDWEEHNPWAAGTEMRAEKAKFNAFCKHHGREEAARRMPEYAKRMGIACAQYATSMQSAGTSSAPSPSPSPSPSPKELKRSRGSRLPADWKPDESLISWAGSERPDIDLRTEVQKFRDYWSAKAGKDGIKLDWPATFRNWIRNARAIPGVTKSKTTQFFEEQIGQINEHMAAHGNQDGPVGAGLPQLGTYTSQRGAGVRSGGECLGLGIDAGSGMGRAARYSEASDGIFAHADGMPGMAEPS